MKNNFTKLDQLTSLRFVAAIMIVIHHSVGLFGIEKSEFNLGIGVSFFFVLSGFILTYVYPNLNSKIKVKQFWKARIARIYPAYIASFLFGFWLIPYTFDISLITPFIFMLQGWIPNSSHYFSYNAVSWSVSTEFFFYLLFPFILYKWEKTWTIKILISGGVIVILVMLSNFLELPVYSAPNSKNTFLVTQHGLMYINPLSRIFEFIFGMVMALLFKNRQSLVTNNKYYKATIYEICIVIMCIGSMYFMRFIAVWDTETMLSPAINFWIVKSGSVFVLGGAIYILAHGHGMISRVLAQPFFVLLGEISFSIYLIHQILLNYYRINLSSFIQLPNIISFSIYVVILLLISYLMWVYIEMPGRRLILGYKKMHGSRNIRRPHLKLNLKIVVDLAILFFVIFLITLTKEKMDENQTISSDSNIASYEFKKNLFNESNIIIYRFKDANLTFNTPRIEMIQNNINRLVIKSTHNDPQIKLPELNIKASKLYILYSHIYVSKSTYMQLFYSDLNKSRYNFSENRVINTFLNKGINEVYILLDDQNLGKTLRLDPVTDSGINIEITDLEIRQVI